MGSPVKFLYSFLLDLFEMDYFSVIMYLVNAVLFAVMLFLTFINPSLLHCQYWDYILIGLFTAIVFHTGHQTGRSK